MALKTIVLNAIEKEIEDYAKKMEKLIKQEAHVKTGALRESVSTEKKGRGYYRVGVDVQKLKKDDRNIERIDYSPFYYYGHDAYTIFPKTAKALRWVGKDGKIHFAKKVRMPAHAGDPFIDRAIVRRPKI